MKRLIPVVVLSLLVSGCSNLFKKEKVSEKNENGYKITVESNEVSANQLIDVINCPITPEVESDMRVPKIYKTNNLRKRTGYASFAKGEFIVISGIITDSYCVPVKNATVQIWHADASGNYKSVPNDGYLNDSMMYGKQVDRFEQVINGDVADENFTGSGSTTTDNLGRFIFLSVMPGGSKPLVNFRVVHKDFNDMKTVMYFKNATSVNQLLVAKKSGSVENDEIKEDIYQYNITLNGKNKYLNY
jgi:protocatechuate 3,4-dioxygenase beta subunit